MTIPNFESRYVLPTFEERTAYGYKRQDPYAKLFEDRIIFLGSPIYDDVANAVIAQMLFLQSDEACEVSYKDRGGKYQGQLGVTLPRA